MLSLPQRLNAITTLAEGGVIAYPTESVYGYGCDPFNANAVARLLRLKRRPQAKGLILVAADMEQIAPLLAGVSRQQLAQLQAAWPGPVTWLIPDPNQWVPDWVRGRFDSVAVRVSAHPLVAELCRAWGGPIVSTSANLSNRPPARSEYSLRVMARFAGEGADYILPGSTAPGARPTEIRDLQSGRIIRPG